MRAWQIAFFAKWGWACLSTRKSAKKTFLVPGMKIECKKTQKKDCGNTKTLYLYLHDKRRKKHRTERGIGKRNCCGAHALERVQAHGKRLGSSNFQKRRRFWCLGSLQGARSSQSNLRKALEQGSCIRTLQQRRQKL